MERKQSGMVQLLTLELCPGFTIFARGLICFGVFPCLVVLLTLTECLSIYVSWTDMRKTMKGRSYLLLKGTVSREFYLDRDCRGLD